MYWDSVGRPYPVSRTDGDIDGFVRDENLFERVMGRGNGGQFDAFFAVFGPTQADGRTPVPLFDKCTGRIDRSVAEYYKAYDICLRLRNNPQELEQLAGKIHVICGDEDNYYLDRACRELQKLIESTADATAAAAATPCANYVKLIPGDHQSIKTQAFYTTIFAEIATVYKASSQ